MTLGEAGAVDQASQDRRNPLMASQQSHNSLLVRAGASLAWVWMNSIVMFTTILYERVVTYRRDNMSVAPPDDEGPGPSDEAVADFCHFEYQKRSNKLI